MRSSPRSHWFDQPTLVNQFPWLYRQYARYCRLIVNRSSGRVRGGTGLFKVFAPLHAWSCRGEDFSVNYRDNRIFLNLTDNRIFEALAEATEESCERQILESLLRPGDTFIDIGANHGSYSLVASHIVGSKGLVLAFEPQLNLARLIELSLAKTGASEFMVFNAGCGDRVQTTEFYIPRHASGSAGVFKGFSGSGKHAQTKIQLTTLDESLSRIVVRQALFLKLDVEGSEFDTLRGGRNIIEKYHPPILFEVNPSSASASGRSVEMLFDLLASMGYRKVCEIQEFPSTKDIGSVSTEQQRNLLALYSD